ncbi:MAG: protein kinase, partial [Thermoanaerobaculia bacterium]|nr:protein kinase [Thermoanaerobaculia bacterium]
MIGETISHYRVLSQLGKGGMGVVYEAEDTTLERRVALKFLPEEMAKDEAALQRFQREAKAASALNHPGICTVYAIDQHQGNHFIVMELLEGETLADRIRRGPLEIQSIVEYAVQMADALESAHAKGIVHRDLKPANVFINTRDQVKILDFGLAKIDPSKKSGESGVVTAVRQNDLTGVGATIGTVAYMSPEQARGLPTDARTDIFSFGTVLYQMATGVMPFQGETSAVIFEAILNREPQPVQQLNSTLPSEFAMVIEKALEKDRNLRCQNVSELKTDFMRLRKKLDSGSHSSPQAETSRGDSRPGTTPGAKESAVAVLYFENLSDLKEDEYLRDGVTEDIITELSKIKGLKVFSRATVLVYRDKQATPGQIGQQLGASYVLTGSIRRAGNRLRINAQLVDTNTDFPIWSERYDREMKDVFEVQDEIAHKIAEALRITLSPQEKEALAAKPTENAQAYDLYLRGRTYARRLSRQDLEFALQMFGHAVSLDPDFALAHAAIANVCAQFHYNHERTQNWIDRAKEASRRASELNSEAPEVVVAEAWILHTEGKFDEAARRVRQAIAKKPDAEGAYDLLGQTLFAAGRYQELVDMSDIAIAQAGEDYNIYVPLLNALGALGKTDALKNTRVQAISMFENHIRKVPEDARA